MLVEYLHINLFKLPLCYQQKVIENEGQTISNKEIKYKNML
jgi:hypothetical protein